MIETEILNRFRRIEGRFPKRSSTSTQEGHVHASGVVGARATRDTTQGVAPGSFVKIQYATEDYDTNAAYSTTNFDFTVPVAGRYIISGQVVIAFGSASADSIISIFVNGVSTARGSHLEVAAGITVTLMVDDVLNLALNDVVDIRVSHASAGTEDVIAGATSNHFSIIRIFSAGTTGSGVATAHGTLSGLSNDDHTQYLLVDGSRNLTGNLTVSAGVTIDGIDVGAHVHSGGSLGLTVDHGALTGLADDDHSQYARLAGRAGGQTLKGGTGAADSLVL